FFHDADHFADRRDLPAVLHDLRNDAAHRRGQFDGGLVGLDLDDRLVLFGPLAGLLEPCADLHFGNRFADLGDFEFNCHIFPFVVPAASLPPAKVISSALQTLSSTVASVPSCGCWPSPSPGWLPPAATPTAPENDPTVFRRNGI